MRVVRRRSIAWITGMVMALGAAAPALAGAAVLASTGNADSVGRTTADLNGVVDAARKHSSWLFQYSATPGFTAAVTSTARQPVGLGVTVVERRVSGLAAGTVYYWRVVLESRGAKATYGKTATLTTTGTPATKPYTFGPGPVVLPKDGHARLRTAVVKVMGGHAAVKLSCTGGSGAHCAGSLRLTVLHHAEITCGTAKLATRAPRSPTVWVALSKTCLSLLSGAAGHTWPVAVHATFTTHQASMTARAKLVG